MSDVHLSADPTAVGVPARNWWGRMWLAQISVDTARFAKDVMQGEALFRRGAVLDLQVAAGMVRAQVVDRNDTATVELDVDVLASSAWGTVTTVVAERLRFTAALLRHQFPEELHQRLVDHDVDLFASGDALQMRSDRLGDGVNRHTVAVHRALGMRIDRDPNVLFGLRGRDIELLLTAVATKRGDTARPVELVDSTPEEKVATLRQLLLHPRLADDPGWLLATLDDPPVIAPYETVRAITDRAATIAWRIAAGAGQDVADTELLLAELRARRIGTAAVLADAIGHGETVVAALLDALFDAGVVLRTGNPPNVKYRVAHS